MASTVAVLERLKPVEYHKQFLANGLRPDGRGLDEVRQAKIWRGVFESNGIVGSALLSAGHTRLTAAVSAEIAPPAAAFGAGISATNRSGSNRGRVLFNVDIPRACAFEVGRDVGAVEGSTAANRSASEAASQLTVSLNHIFSSPSILDLDQLVIGGDDSAKRGSWVLYVNVVCLEHDGNLGDWAVAVVAAALDDVRLPALDWDEKASWWRLASHPSPKHQPCSPPLNFKLREMPCSATIVCIAEEYWVADPTAIEERIGKSFTVWMTARTGQMQLLGPSGAALDVQSCLQTLFQATLSAMSSMYRSIVTATPQSTDMWELCN